jgi:two-component system CheB/CheR fusion protein
MNEGRLSADAHAILETLSSPVFVLDAQLRVETVNRAFGDAFGVTPAEAEGRLVYSLGQGAWDIPALRAALADLLATDDRRRDLVVEQDLPRMGRRIMALTARKLPHEEGGRERILVALEDRTEAGRAEEAERTRNEFVATLSHELRGPLNSMVGWIHLLRAGAGLDAADVQRGLAAIERGVVAQTRLVEDLLDYSRLVMGKLHLVRRPTDLVPLAQAAAESARAATEAKAISLQVASEPGTALVLGDPDRLQQIVWNLLSNAVKFTPRHGTIRVSITRVDTRFHIVVSDTGEGIAPDFLPRVFDRFRQGHGATPGQPGLGLGLAIVKQLVEQHGGSVHAESAGEGRGATFTVALPIPALLLETEGEEAAGARIGEAVASEKDRAGRPQRVLQGVRALIVEDDADGREMLAAVLQQHGASVTQATSAREAMRTLEQTSPDVLVCDIGLPDENGHQLIRRVREMRSPRRAAIPALALTAYAAATDREKALSAGFDLHLAKPAAPADVVAAVAALALGGRGR